MSRMRTRKRLTTLIVAFVVTMLGLTTLALAQEHGGAGNSGNSGNSGHLPPGHPPTGGAIAPPGHADPPGHATPPSEGEEAHHDAGGHHGPAAINWTDIWDKKRPAVLALVINFGVLMTLYYMLGKKPITAALKQRRVTIGKEIDEAQKLLDEAKERATKYQAGLKSADADAATAKASLISAGQGEVERVLLEAQERADRMKRDAERLVEQESKQVHQDLVNETVEQAVREAAQILEKSVTADDHARLAQDLLAELATRPGAVRSGGVRPPTAGTGSTGGAT